MKMAHESEGHGIRDAQQTLIIKKKLKKKIQVKKESQITRPRSSTLYLFQTERIRLRISIFAQIKVLHRLLAKRTTASFGQQRLTPDQLHATRKRRLGLAVFADALVGRGDTAHTAARVAQQLK